MTDIVIETLTCDHAYVRSYYCSSMKLHMLHPVCHTIYRLPLITLTMTLLNLQ